METTNAALIAPDVLKDCALLFEAHAPASPGQFHALHSLVEATVLHEHSFLYLPKESLRELPDQLFGPLLAEGVLEVRETPGDFEREMEQRGLNEQANAAFLDRSVGHSIVSYAPGTLVQLLHDLVEFEQKLGFDQMSRLQDTNMKALAFFSHDQTNLARNM